MSPRTPASTTADPRYGNSGAGPTSWAETLGVIEQAQLFWLTTVRADGRPHCVPLVGIWSDDRLFFTTGDEEQKFLNLATNPHVTLTTGCNAWDQGVDVVIEGDAEPVTDTAALTRMAEVWATMWDGRWQVTARDGRVWHDEEHGAHAFAVTPTKVLAFAKGGFSQTTHRFA